MYNNANCVCVDGKFNVIILVSKHFINYTLTDFALRSLSKNLSKYSFNFYFQTHQRCGNTDINHSCPGYILQLLLASPIIHTSKSILVIMEAHTGTMVLPRSSSRY